MNGFILGGQEEGYKHRTMTKDEKKVLKRLVEQLKGAVELYIWSCIYLLWCFVFFVLQHHLQLSRLLTIHECHYWFIAQEIDRAWHSVEKRPLSSFVRLYNTNEYMNTSSHLQEKKNWKKAYRILVSCLFYFYKHSPNHLLLSPYPPVLVQKLTTPDYATLTFHCNLQVPLLTIRTGSFASYSIRFRF